jgi:hypothetical protein
MDLPTFTLVHVLISVLGIVAGLVVAGGFAAGRLLVVWNDFFLAMTVLTSITGFGFPFVKVTPAHVFGVLSLAALVVALFALYGKRLAGRWRATYVVTAMVALYLNAFVLVVQLLQKIPVLAKLAPEGSAGFGGAQLAVLVVFVWLGWAALRGFKEAK